MAWAFLFANFPDLQDSKRGFRRPNRRKSSTNVPRQESEGEVTQGETASFDRSDRVLPGEPFRRGRGTPQKWVPLPLAQGLPGQGKRKGPEQSRGAQGLRPGTESRRNGLEPVERPVRLCPRGFTSSDLNPLIST